ncbi:MAG TPA: glycosyltransferase [Gaiellaceae bacterium]|nr:glycosyltransferase [Gaiellaceae bacterium]
MASPVAVLIAARDEEGRIARAVEQVRAAFPGAEVIVADDGSRDATAEAAERAGAHVLRLARRGKGQALSLAEREAPAGPLVVCDADLDGDLSPLAAADADLAIAVFAERQGGGFGLAKRAARALIRARSGFVPLEPLSGQRSFSEVARAVCFPLAAGFGCEVGASIDAARANARLVELELPLRHRATGRDLAGFLHRGRQLLDALLACGPQGRNFRGLRLPIVGAVAALGQHPAVVVAAAAGLADDLWSGPERGFRAHLRARNTTGVLKLVAIPLAGLLATRKLSGALLVGLAANFLNQLDTRPGRALKGYLVGAFAVRAPVGVAVLLLPYDLRERTMLGDCGANALGALLGLKSVSRLTDRGRWLALGALAGLTLLGERRSLGDLIERTPGLSHLDRLGRYE